MSKLHDEMSMTKSVAKSKFPLRKSLKYFMWTSLVKRRLLAMFCKILHMSVRPRFILGVGSMSTRPYSWGLISTGLMKRKNITVPTAWKPAWRNLCDTMEYKQWHTMRKWSGNILAELTMAFMTLWVSWRRFWRFSSTFSFGSTRDGSTFFLEKKVSKLSFLHNYSYQFTSYDLKMFSGANRLISIGWNNWTK